MLKLIMELLRRLFGPKYPSITLDKVWPKQKVGYTVLVHNEYGIAEPRYYNTMVGGNLIKNLLPAKREIISLKKKPTLGDEIFEYVMNYKGNHRAYVDEYRIYKNPSSTNPDALSDYIRLEAIDRPLWENGHIRNRKKYNISHGKHGNLNDLFHEEEIKAMFQHCDTRHKEIQEKQKIKDLKGFIS